MHATCGYHAKSTWIEAIRRENYAGWPLLTVENVHKHYLETDKTPMGRLNQTRAYARLTNPRQAPLQESTTVDLKALVGKKEKNVFFKIIDTRDVKNTCKTDILK